MAKTPEKRVKDKVDILLKRYDVYYEKPVTNGYGKNSLDYIGCSRGRFFAVETKAPGKQPTALQEYVAADIRARGGVVFWVTGDDGLKELEAWLRPT